MSMGHPGSCRADSPIFSHDLGTCEGQPGDSSPKLSQALAGLGPHAPFPLPHRRSGGQEGARVGKPRRGTGPKAGLPFACARKSYLRRRHCVALLSKTAAASFLNRHLRPFVI